jgi:hypothetical protein
MSCRTHRNVCLRAASCWLVLRMRCSILRGCIETVRIELRARMDERGLSTCPRGTTRTAREATESGLGQRARGGAR